MTVSAVQPATLDHAGIAARIPHSGSMCLLDALLSWSADTIRCTAVGHRDAEHPLRSAGRLPAPVAIEYAAQAMALHGTLCAAPGAAPRPGFLASVRGVRLLAPRLDDIDGALLIRAARRAGHPARGLSASPLPPARAPRRAHGRATVILNILP